ncbi:hypothetical protein [Phytomonospora endophytica]|uniref:Nucleotidyltransferase AbiEii toxin of type IV toxin-antitoxin system n=1 Tax=Phytomonospora endophytica TaxID=714109 RepID=A0A841FM82_9ACTN|nr:hypothetical protein [Phytomonospora endophytica]MBB6033060.1 hypothetical protein [Phytomonospora endophytica]GIG65287.1 hypothetical protein Pen01_15820 [Phytomonospora endophytica]
MTTPERTPVRLPSLAAATGELWTLLIDLAVHAASVPWTLVGGQMVMLHGLERDREAPRVSADIDTVVDLRAKQDGLRALVGIFERLGLEAVGPPSPDGIMHRYVTYEDRTADIPRPDLLGALVIKAAATEIELKSPTRHFRDLAFLCSLVDDPFALRERTDKKDRQRLGFAAARMPDDDSLWTVLGAHERDARATWRILAAKALRNASRHCV